MKIKIEEIKKAYVSYIPKSKVNKLHGDEAYSSIPNIRFVCVDEDSNCFTVVKGFAWDTINKGELSIPCKSNVQITETFLPKQLGKSKKSAIENYVAIKNNRVPFDYDIYEYWSTNNTHIEADKLTAKFSQYFSNTFTAEDFNKILNRYPNLTANGFGNPSESDFQSARQDLQNLLSEFQCSCVYLSRRRKAKPFKMDFTSYGLKHMAERQFGTYVSNGALIAAGLHLGFEYSVFGPNACFKMSQQEYISNEEI